MAGPAFACFNSQRARVSNPRSFRLSLLAGVERTPEEESLALLPDPSRGAQTGQKPRLRYRGFDKGDSFQGKFADFNAGITDRGIVKTASKELAEKYLWCNVLLLFFFFLM